MTSPGAERIGEVVATSSLRLTVQCYELYGSPPLGALVRAGDPPVYAVVSEIYTEALDPGRPIIARGRDEATEEDVFRNNPQLDRLLCTRFHGVAVGGDTGTGPAPGLPAQPSRIHAFVHGATGPEAEALFGGPGLLGLLLSSGGPLPDEVIAACLTQAARIAADPARFLEESARRLARELSGDLPRLNALLRRLA